MRIKEYAKSLPSLVKKELKQLYYGVVPLRFRYGKVFREFYDFLSKSQWWSKKELEEYQMKQIQDFDDLKKFPYLIKDDGLFIV